MYKYIESCSVVVQVNHDRYGFDINVARVWERNITGHGVTAAVVDDGTLHSTHQPILTRQVTRAMHHV